MKEEVLLKQGDIISMPIENMSSGFKRGSIIFNANLEGSSVSQAMHIVRKGEEYTTDMGFHLTHLYLFTQEDVTKGTLILGKTQLIEPAKENVKNVNRLVATTDTNLPAARFSKKFLNNYVETNGIHKVIIECNVINDRIELKKSKRNIISLRDFKKDYTRGEVIDLLDELVKEIHINKHFNYEEWKSNNL